MGLQSRHGVSMRSVAVSVICGGSVHRVSREHDHLRLHDHDIGSESALVALGGEMCACAIIEAAWNRWMANGGRVVSSRSPTSSDPIDLRPLIVEHQSVLRQIEAVHEFRSHGLLARSARRRRTMSPDRFAFRVAATLDRLRLGLGLRGDGHARLVATADRWRDSLVIQALPPAFLAPRGDDSFGGLRRKLRAT